MGSDDLLGRSLHKGDKKRIAKIKGEEKEESKNRMLKIRQIRKGE